jgi:hypothetical protein
VIAKATLAAILGTMACLAAQDSQAPAPTSAQQTKGDKAPVKQEELDQMLAPIALYPDALLTQILMATSYPLEIVEADRWAKANKSLTGDAKAKALEKEDWDPSVKSLVDFPAVLEMLSMKLDWTQKLGDAFIGQQKDVLDTVQKLRGKAKENGQLESSENQKVEVKEGDPQVITIESTSPQVIYVPTYNPTVVYGSWWYPAYPPYPYYPPGYVAGTAFMSFAVGVAWGYAWGHCDWGHGDVDIDINRNTEFNRNIDRDKYKNRANNTAGNTMRDGKGKWQHDPSHRGSVPYRDNKAAQKYGGISSNDAARARSSYRGRAETGRAELSRGAADTYKADAARARTGDTGARAPSTSDRSSRSSAGNRGSTGSTRSSSTTRGSSTSRSGALSGVRSSGSSTQRASSRGSMSRGGGGRGGGRR